MYLGLLHGQGAVYKGHGKPAELATSTQAVGLSQHVSDTPPPPIPLPYCPRLGPNTVLSLQHANHSLNDHALLK